MSLPTPVRRFGRWILLALLTALTAPAQTAVIFVTDASGNVGAFHPGTATTTSVGSLAPDYTPGQVIGLAYDPTANRLLIFDRSARKVYAMNPQTGEASVLFSTPDRELQGGAVLNGLVYGIDEGRQILAAYSLAGVDQNIPALSLPDHVHALGLVPENNQLIYASTNIGVRKIGTDGTQGTTLLDAELIGSFNAEDVDYFNGNYLVASYGNTLISLDGSTGAQSVFLTDTQLGAMGVTGSLSGVAVTFVAVPEPGTWALLLTGLAVIAWTGCRRRR